MNIHHNDFDNQLFTTDVSTSEVLLNDEITEAQKEAWYEFEYQMMMLNREDNF